MSCLIIVERAITEKNNVAAMVINKGIKKYFKNLKAELGEKELNQITNNDNSETKNSVGVIGNSHEITLTSVILGTILDKEGVPFEIIDADDVLMSYGDHLNEKIKSYPIIAISTTYVTNINTITKILEYIRDYSRKTNPDLKIILGGQGLISWLNNQEIGKKIFDQLNLADYFVFGDADVIFKELIRRILKGDIVDNVEGVIYNGKDHLSGSSDIISVNVKDIVSPDWGITRRYCINNSETGIRLSSVGIEEGRGCHFKCKFCAYSANVKFRRKDVATIIEELKNIEKNEIKNAAFLGAEFLMPISFSKPTLQEIEKLKLPIEFWAYCRLDVLSKKPLLIDLLYNANFKSIHFGLESGSKKILKGMNKNFDPGRIANAVKMLKDKQIEVRGSIIIGFPGETKETIQETKQVLKESNFTELGISGLAMMPGTPLYEERESFGVKITPYGWSHETMRLTDIPYHIKDVIIFITKYTDTLILNLMHSHAPHFFKTNPSKEKIKKVTKILQRLISNEWCSEGYDYGMKIERTALFKELKNEIDFIPKRYLN